MEKALNNARLDKSKAVAEKEQIELAFQAIKEQLKESIEYLSALNERRHPLPLGPSAFANVSIIASSYLLAMVSVVLPTSQPQKGPCLFFYGPVSQLLKDSTEDEKNPLKIPTKENIRLALRWLVQGSRVGDSLVFHFSGHGSQVAKNDMNESEGLNETLCPLDYETQGMIVDDELYETIVKPLPNGVVLHAIIDACYSGTILNLPFICKMNREGYYTWEEQKCFQNIYKGISGGLAVCISACNDDQISVDTTALAGNIATGALTYSFIQAVENEPGLTYGRLLIAMRQAIREAKTGGLRLTGPIASLINRTLFNSEIAQEPQLSSSDKFEIYCKQFLL
ncbi:metacaspase-1-like [Mercurialis annua]|uniref:metacaspase-1-like n=1 Tax=Mercurialis annua TaxID=3986 RepID=UPI00215E102B|nr:metacaspase-1-like [Mercurialis annua]